MYLYVCNSFVGSSEDAAILNTSAWLIGTRIFVYIFAQYYYHSQIFNTDIIKPNIESVFEFPQHSQLILYSCFFFFL